MEEWSEIYAFWFGAPGSNGHGEVREFWFGGGPDLDREISERFTEDYFRAVAGDCDDWKLNGQGCIALIVLLDQFPRNIFRGDPQSFAADAKALEIAKYLSDSPLHDGLLPVERLFAYLPFEHSENRDDQARSVSLYQAMDDHEMKSEWVEFAVEHKVIIDEFGRFPHRNAILGRKNTPAETAWLATSTQHFGIAGEDPDTE